MSTNIQPSSKMDASVQTSPIPTRPSTVSSTPKHTELLITTWPQSTTATSFSTLPVIAYKTMPPPPIGKPMPNRRGRKPLATPPTDKKHEQNLYNQRKFRQRRDAYVKDLEARVREYEDQLKEMGLVCAQIQEENRSLREKVVSLEKYWGKRNELCDDGLSISSTEIQLANKISGSRDVNSCSGSSIYSVQDIIESTHMNKNQIYQELHKDENSCDVVMGDASDYGYNSGSASRHNLLPLDNISYQQQMLPSYLSSFDFNNEQTKEKYSFHRQQTKNGTNSSMSVEDIINSPLFCERDGDICFCESSVTIDDLELNDAKTPSQMLTNNSRYLVTTPETGKQICMIIPPFPECEDPTRSAQGYPNLQPPEPQWQQLSQNEHYLPQSFPTSSLSQPYK
ncbi:12985_t:CDS:2 [Acaulospora colombiana]|uniref:12985_t:CDS:1 n=1 Tax=Acaulospora colombiana TaxID=27376 RepID=A0ACA9LTM9_9GLOM|nr:12985_t:CDS:2 [Acaulospora colombiana]